MNEIENLLAEIEGWNAGDKDSFQRTGELPIDGAFVFVARQKVITKLRNALKKLNKP